MAAFSMQAAITSVSGWRPILRWGKAGRGPEQRWYVADNTIMDLRALSGNRLVFGAATPAFGVLDAKGKMLVSRSSGGGSTSL